MRTFAPLSNKITNPSRVYDILLATDAHGVGINLQDAATVVNYDLAWTAVEPDQRAGRILRFWPSPREANLYVIFPAFRKDSIHRRQSNLVLRRWERLTSRHAQAKIIMDMPTITRQAQQEIILNTLGGEQRIIKVGEIDLQELIDLESSKIFDHTATLDHNRDEAMDIPDDIISAMAYEGKERLLYLLFKINDKYQWAIYDLNHRQLTNHKTDIELLQLILCNQKTPKAAVDPNDIEKAVDQCIKVWCARNKASQDDITRICAMYLIPEKFDLFENMLE